MPQIPMTLTGIRDWQVALHRVETAQRGVAVLREDEIMGHSSRILPVTVLVGVLVLLQARAAPGHRAGSAPSSRPAHAHSATTQPRIDTRETHVPQITTLLTAPAQLAVLDTATFTTTFHNRGPHGGPYRAILELVPMGGGPAHTLAQSGFSLEHNQRLTLYWEWRAGTSLPPGTYTVRVLLHDATGTDDLIATGTDPERLTVHSRQGGTTQ